jgi:hypothetical protein
METDNRPKLDKLVAEFREWLHIDDPSIIYTLAATKFSHRIPGDTIWLMLIGPSSGGKSELLKAFSQEGELNIDDLTTHTFVSGYRSKDTNDILDFAETLAQRIWYIYDLSILLSKSCDERGIILSDMRMVYDGKIKKIFGNKYEAEAECPHNTLICGSTPAVDNTILEDQMLGTRFVQFRIKRGNRMAMMECIDRNHERMAIMRERLILAVKEFELSVFVNGFAFTEEDNRNIQLLTNMTTLLRTAVSMDRQGEPSNIAYPEEPGRFYKQLKKMYQSYRVIGLTEEEALKCLRQICVDNVNPLRVKLLKVLSDAPDRMANTTQLHTRTGIGKKAVKTHLHTLHLLDMVDYEVEEDQFGRAVKDKWTLRDVRLNALLGGKYRTLTGRSMYPLYRSHSKISSYMPNQTDPSPHHPPI